MSFQAEAFTANVMVEASIEITLLSVLEMLLNRVTCQTPVDPKQKKKKRKAQDAMESLQKLLREGEVGEGALPRGGCAGPGWEWRTRLAVGVGKGAMQEEEQHVQRPRGVTAREGGRKRGGRTQGRRREGGKRI